MTTLPPLHADPCPILATAVVPWTEQYAFDEETFRRQVRTIARGLTRRIYIFGTAGEGHAVAERQFEQIAGCFWKVAEAETVSPMLGVISLSLATVIERIELGQALGFRQFQISLPAWGALNDAELGRFFSETCGRFPDCQFLHYNLARSRRVLTAAEYARLTAAHPNLVAVKMSSEDLKVLGALMQLAPRLRVFLTEFGYVQARRLGRCGLLASLATANYACARKFVHEDDETRQAMVPELRAIAAGLNAAASGRYHMDGAFDKMLFRLNDPNFPLRLLPPYEAATEEDFVRFHDLLPVRWRNPSP